MLDEHYAYMNCFVSAIIQELTHMDIYPVLQTPVLCNPPVPLQRELICVKSLQVCILVSKKKMIHYNINNCTCTCKVDPRNFSVYGDAFHNKKISLFFLHISYNASSKV